MTDPHRTSAATNEHARYARDIVGLSKRRHTAEGPQALVELAPSLYAEIEGLREAVSDQVNAYHTARKGALRLEAANTLLRKEHKALRDESSAIIAGLVIKAGAAHSKLDDLWKALTDLTATLAPYLEHLAGAECACDHSVGLTCETCLAANHLNALRRVLSERRELPQMIQDWLDGNEAEAAK